MITTFALALTLLSPTGAQQTSGCPRIDLTTPEPESQQGLGVPGGSAGTFEPANYELPLRAEIIGTSRDKAGDFILEVQLKNTGQGAFDLPISRNISDVQRTPGKSRREFFFQVRPVFSKSRTVEEVGSAVTAGSVTVPHSFLRLQPQGSVRVLLRAESRLVREAVPRETKQLDVRVTCGEWTFDDSRFLTRAVAQNLASSNTVTLAF